MRRLTARRIGTITTKTNWCAIVFSAPWTGYYQSKMHCWTGKPVQQCILPVQRTGGRVPGWAYGDLDTQTPPVHILLFVAVLFIYGTTTFYSPVLEVVLVFITIYLHIYFIENCQKLRTCIPNFGHTLIYCYWPKLRFCSLTSDTKTCFKKTITTSEQI